MMMWDNCFCNITKKLLEFKEKDFGRLFFCFPSNTSCYTRISSNSRSWEQFSCANSDGTCFTRHIHALRYYRETTLRNKSVEFVTRTIPRNLLRTAAAVRPHLATFPRGPGLYLNHFSLTIISALEGHKLNRAALISTRNSPDCNSRNIRMRVRVWERAEEPHYIEGSFSVPHPPTLPLFRYVSSQLKST